MDNSNIEKIKERVDIVDVVKTYLKLEKTGINYRTQCPFHSEKKPSFFVSPTRQMFKCFGCGEQGSVFDFTMKIEGVEFKEALSMLAKRAGVELKPVDPKQRSEREKLRDIAELGCRFFETQLEKSSAGKTAKQYLLSRGITEDSVKKWRLGYAPDEWRALSDFLVGKGYERGDIVKAGLAVESEKAPYDRFRKRIIFPVFDLHSQVIGFGGRIAEDVKETAKYINTPNTPLYDKSKTLYGLNFAKVEVRKAGFAVLTEGYTDVILSHQAGFGNTVASSGTSLTPYHLRILKRYTRGIRTAFDMDLAGETATKKGIDLAREQDFDVRVIDIPKDQDPADIVKQDPEQWKKLVENGEEIMDFYFKSALHNFDAKTPTGKRNISETVLPEIKKIPNRIIQSHWVQKLSNLLRIQEEAVWEELKGSTSAFTKKPQEVETKAEIKSRKRLVEEQLLCLILKSAPTIKEVRKEMLDYFSPDLKPVFSGLIKEKDKICEGEKQLNKVLERIGKDHKEVVDKAALTAETGQDTFLPEEASDIETEARLCVAELDKIRLKEELNSISQAIERAEKEGNQKELEKLLINFNLISKKIN